MYRQLFTRLRIGERDVNFSGRHVQRVRMQERLPLAINRRARGEGLSVTETLFQVRAHVGLIVFGGVIFNAQRVCGVRVERVVGVFQQHVDVCLSVCLCLFSDWRVWLVHSAAFPRLR